MMAVLDRSLPTLKIETSFISVNGECCIAFAYVTPQSRRLFRLYPHVLKFDVTMGTNEERRPLLIVSGRTPWGENFIIMRAYLPNERAWVFRWVFQIAMPKLLGVEYLLLVRMALTDGDMQEISQLDSAISTYLRNAKRRRCSYHVIHRGWINNGPSGKGVVDKNKVDQWHILVERILGWMFSWVTSGSCPTRAHYQISKALLQQYLDTSPQVKSIASPEVVHRVFTFLRQHVEPHEAYYANFNFKNSLHFEEHSNSALEGLNSGMKRSLAPLRPNHSISKSTSIRLLQNYISTCQMAEKVNRDLITTKLWSALPTASDIEKKGESIIRQNWIRRSEYSCFRANTHEWRVRKKARLPINKSTHPIPRYDPVHVVTIAEQATMFCSCGYFQDCGLPCVHQMAVATDINSCFTGFKTFDVNVVWWSAYHNYGERPEAHPEITQLFRGLVKNGIMGPRIPEVHRNYFESWCPTRIPTEFQVKSPEECCLNYTSSEIRAALERFDAFGITCKDRGGYKESNGSGGNNFDYGGNSLDYDTSHDQDCNVSLSVVIPRKDRPVYYEVMPLVKEWMNLMEDYDSKKKFVDELKENIEAGIARVKAERCCEKKVMRKREPLQSICVATDKRRKLQITKNMVS